MMKIVKPTMNIGIPTVVFPLQNPTIAPTKIQITEIRKRITMDQQQRV
jgi:hypothetical protein